ncbi:MAG: hypothetical protein KGJ41_17990 [Rhodospirillales bacterium]|nr:hypothetical protein [Rhodospirillales bacterium]MDE2200905.1 hypothetical protein [Rhodospirillales bacterium]MDE2576942.1 hypothetical protein [Rhodospirillales bacterium]
MRTPFLVLTAAFALLPLAARADKIDGAWCKDEGHRLTIDGPTIVTPSGVQTQGDYERHFFSYTVPAGEPGAGGSVAMQLLNETTVQITPPGGAAEIWRRCGPSTS